MSAGHAHPPSDDPFERALTVARGILPDQGPIGVFIHHNTLHAFQHLPFHEGVQAGADALGARPYLSLAEFRAAQRAGRIADVDIRCEIDKALGAHASETLVPGLSRAELWRLLMIGDWDTDDAAGLAFALGAGTAGTTLDDPLWMACLTRVRRGPALVRPDERRIRRHRDVLMELGDVDTDTAVHGELIRLGSGFLDQGQAHAVIPGRERGFLRAVTAMYRDGATAPRDCRGAEASMRAVCERETSAEDVIRDSLEALGVRGESVEPFLLATALALPGWGGMFSRLERHPEDNPDGPPVTLVDFLAVRLLLERHAVERACKSAGVSTE
ncbi:MAG: putative inorganic carbon transporter subunit DabA, partial [Gemmatimonas sp.]